MPSRLVEAIVQKERLLDLYQSGQVELTEIEPRLKSIRAKITTLHEECTLVEKDAKAERQRFQLIEQFTAFTQRMQTNLATISFAERKRIVRLLIEEVLVNTTTAEITVRHILPSKQLFSLCKRRSATYSRGREKMATVGFHHVAHRWFIFEC